MNIKMIARFEWHLGHPDGEYELETVVDDFDIENEEEASEIIKKLLTEKEFKKEEIVKVKKERVYLLSKKMSVNGYEVETNIDIGGFHPRYLNVKVEFTPVLEHRGKFYELKETKI